MKKYIELLKNILNKNIRLYRTEQGFFISIKNFNMINKNIDKKVIVKF